MRLSPPVAPSRCPPTRSSSFPSGSSTASRSATRSRPAPIGRGTLDSPGDNIINALTSQLKGSTATANTGYKFDGWYTDAACTQRVDLGLLSNIVNDPNDPTVMISAKLAPTRPSSGWVPMTYYAKFVPGKAEYTIEYYLQGADGNYTKANITPKQVRRPRHR